MPSYQRERGYKADPSKRFRDQQRARDCQAFTPQEDALLGTDTDKAVASIIGRSERAVNKRRYRLGVKAYRPSGRSFLVSGYVYIILAPDDPMVEMTRSDRSVAEHRLVMARHLGRPLTQDERVHHRNGIKTDNRIRNLELWTRSHPEGQRVEDVLEWCVEFIERYAAEADAIFRVPAGQ